MFQVHSFKVIIDIDLKTDLLDSDKYKTEIILNASNQGQNFNWR